MFVGPAKRPDSTTSAGIFGAGAEVPAELAMPARLGVPNTATSQQKVSIKLNVGGQKFKQPLKQGNKSCVLPLRVLVL